MFIKSDKPDKNHSDLSVNGATLSPPEDIKCLGIVDNKLSFNSHTDYLVSKTTNSLFLMKVSIPFFNYTKEDECDVFFYATF